MDRLRQSLAEAGDNWKPALQDAFRQIVLQRVEGYLANGHAALRGYEDKDGPLSLEARFSSLLNRSFFLTGASPRFAEYLDQYPRAPISEVESFIYWSKERLEGKAIISATHVSILRSAESALPDALVAGKGIFATHYVNASLGLTAILRGRPGSPNYLAYVNRSDVDMAGGCVWWTGARVDGAAPQEGGGDGSPRSAATAGKRRSGVTSGASQLRVRPQGISGRAAEIALAA